MKRGDCHSNGSESTRVPSVIVTERGDRIPVSTAYDLDAGQRRDYTKKRTQGEWGQ